MYSAETIRPTFKALGAFLVFRGAARSLLGIVPVGGVVTEAEALATVRLVWKRATGVVVEHKAVSGRADRTQVDITPTF